MNEADALVVDAVAEVVATGISTAVREIENTTSGASCGTVTPGNTASTAPTGTSRMG